MKLATRMIALTLTFLPLLAAAQMGPTEKIVSNVPFEFVVANKVVPAGQWAVKLTSSGTGLAVLSTKAAIYSNVMIDESKQPAERCALVFHRYGDRTFLAAVKLEGSTTMYRLPESKAEAELQARNAPSTEETLVASLR